MLLELEDVLHVELIVIVRTVINLLQLKDKDFHDVRNVNINGTKNAGPTNLTKHMKLGIKK